MFGFFQIPDAVAARMVPKHLLTLSDVEFSFCGEKVVKQLREIEALKGKRDGTKLVFLASDVSRVAREYFAGEYDDAIAEKFGS